MFTFLSPWYIQWAYPGNMALGTNSLNLTNMKNRYPQGKVTCSYEKAVSCSGRVSFLLNYMIGKLKEFVSRNNVLMIYQVKLFICQKLIHKNSRNLSNHATVLGIRKTYQVFICSKVKESVAKHPGCQKVFFVESIY